jgi:hypothetical protein
MPVDTANSIRVFGGWTLQIQMGPISGMRHRKLEITPRSVTHKDEKRPDWNGVSLPSQVPGMLRKQRKGSVPDTGDDIHKAKRRAADIDDAVLQSGEQPLYDRSLAGPPP